MALREQMEFQTCRGLVPTRFKEISLTVNKRRIINKSRFFALSTQQRDCARKHLQMQGKTKKLVKSAENLAETIVTSHRANIYKVREPLETVSTVTSFSY